MGIFAIYRKLCSLEHEISVKWSPLTSWLAVFNGFNGMHRKNIVQLYKIYKILYSVYCTPVMNKYYHKTMVV